MYIIIHLQGPDIVLQHDYVIYKAQNNSHSTPEDVLIFIQMRVNLTATACKVLLKVLLKHYNMRVHFSLTLTCDTQQSGFLHNFPIKQHV